MKTVDVLKLAGGNAKLAELLGISSGAISQWGEDVPQAREWQIKLLKPEWFKKASKKKAQEAV